MAETRKNPNAVALGKLSAKKTKRDAAYFRELGRLSGIKRRKAKDPQDGVTLAE